MADVRFEHVTKRYGQNPPVISDLNLHVRDHELLVLVGPSGCGKSTALRMIAGLEEITAGDLYIGERRVNDITPPDRDIAMVFQNYALYPHMTVYGNMEFALKMRRVPREERERQVRRAAATLGLTEYLDRKPRALSGGQRQRVALGRALVRDPQVFLLDEPLSNLDAKLRVQTRTEIARLHQTTRTTMIYVTHDQVEAMTMGDRIAVLNGGAIQQLGAPQELYDTPANLFVAGFIGSPAMSFFTGRLSRRGDTAVVRIGPNEAASLQLASSLAAHLADVQNTSGREVIVGVRPEDLHLAAEGAANSLTGTVDVIEHLGNEQLIYLQIPGALARAETGAAGTSGMSGTPGTPGTAATTARVGAAEHLRIGERLTLAVDAAKLHLFDPTTTLRLG